LLVFFVPLERFSKITFSVDFGRPIFGATRGSLLALAIPFSFSSP
jgi:hypothetical protein